MNVSKLVAGDKVRLKNQPHKVATIKSISVLPDTCFGGRVELLTPWTKTGERNYCMDTFLKYYMVDSKGVGRSTLST